MGLFFSNIQIRRTENEPDFAQIAAVLTEGRDLSAVDNEEEADIALSVFTVADSPWITVCSDLIEGDFEELGAKARGYPKRCKPRRWRWPVWTAIISA